MNYPRLLQRYKYIFLLILSFILISCGNSKQDVVAVIDGHGIPGAYFLWSQKNIDFRGESHQDQVQTLERFYHIMLRSYEAQLINYPGKKQVQWKIFSDKRYKLMQALYNHEAVDPIITDSLLHKAYKNMQERRQIRHILISDNKSINLISQRTPEEALALARQIKQKIESGELTFQEASQKYSDSIRSDNGGELGFVSWGEMEDAFQDAAWSLPLNQLSDPVKTDYGYHIIQVTAIDSVKMGSYLKELPNIRSRLIQRYRGKISDQAQQSLEKIQNEMAFSFNDSTAIQISAQMHNLYQQAQVDSTDDPDLVELFKQIEYHPVGSIGNDKITRQDFVLFLQADQGYAFQGLPHAVSLATQMRSFFEQETFLRYAKRIHLDQTQDFKFNMRSTDDLNYSESYLNNVVLANFPPGEDSLRAYYERNKLQKYTDSLKVHVREIYLANKEQAQQIKKKLDNGADFAQLAAQYTERSSAKDQAGDLGWFPYQRYGPIGQAAARMQPGEIRGPLQVGQGWSVIRLLDKSTVNMKPFEDVKSQVRSDYIRQYRSAIIDNNIRKLEQKYNSKLNYDFLNTI